MTELQSYLAEKVAEDHADGIITRREAIRRLGLLGVTGAAASSLLAVVASSAEGSAGRKRSGRNTEYSRGPRGIDWAPVVTEAITFPARAAL